MTITRKQREVIEQLWELDAQQREIILGRIARAAQAQRIITRAGSNAGALKHVKGVPDHKIVRAYGFVPRRKKSGGSGG